MCIHVKAWGVALPGLPTALLKGVSGMHRHRR